MSFTPEIHSRFEIKGSSDQSRAEHFKRQIDKFEKEQYELAISREKSQQATGRALHAAQLQIQESKGKISELLHERETLLAQIDQQADQLNKELIRKNDLQDKLKCSKKLYKLRISELLNDRAVIVEELIQAKFQQVQSAEVQKSLNNEKCKLEHQVAKLSKERETLLDTIENQRDQLDEEIEKSLVLNQRLNSLKLNLEKKISELLDANDQIIELAVNLGRERILSSELKKEVENRIEMQHAIVKISNLKIKAFELRNASESMKMRHPLFRSALDATTDAANWFNKLVCMDQFACRPVYEKFQKMEKAILEINLEIYKLKTDKTPTDFFALSESQRKAQVKRYELDPYLLMPNLVKCEPASGNLMVPFGPRHLDAESFSLINEPTSLLKRAPLNYF